MQAFCCVTSVANSINNGSLLTQGGVRIVNFIIYICAFTTVTCQNVFFYTGETH